MRNRDEKNLKNREYIIYDVIWFEFVWIISCNYKEYVDLQNRKKKINKKFK